MYSGQRDDLVNSTTGRRDPGRFYRHFPWTLTDGHGFGEEEKCRQMALKRGQLEHREVIQR